MQKNNDKFNAQELNHLFALISSRSQVAIAVSGGVDSMALLALADRWRTERLALGQLAPKITVFSVDHGLRPEAGDECRFVKQKARALGYDTQILTWQGEKPSTRIQEVARQNRYRLLVGACHSRGIKTLLTAHHLDDQAETFFMRLGRGSGVDGLAAMAFESRMLGLKLVRPLLDIPKKHLVELLDKIGWDHIDDPGNNDLSYERIRLRHNQNEMERLGLTPEKVCLSANRLRRARVALEQQRDHFLKENALVSPYGSARIDQLAFDDAADEIALRVLAKVLRICGGNREIVSMRKLESLTEKLRNDFSTSRTLAGCRIIAKGDFWLIVREVGRIAEHQKTVRPDDCIFWDNRYTVCAGKDAPGDIVAGPLGHIKQLDELHGGSVVTNIPKEALPSLLVLRRGGNVIAAPALDIWSDQALEAGIRAKFITSDDGLV